MARLLSVANYIENSIERLTGISNKDGKAEGKMFGASFLSRAAGVVPNALPQ